MPKGPQQFFITGEESEEEGERIPWPRTSALFFLLTSLVIDDGNGNDLKITKIKNIIVCVAFFVSFA